MLLDQERARHLAGGSGRGPARITVRREDAAGPYIISAGRARAGPRSGAAAGWPAPLKSPGSFTN